MKSAFSNVAPHKKKAETPLKVIPWSEAAAAAIPTAFGALLRFTISV
jgi:hypothetical protein